MATKVSDSMLKEGVAIPPGAVMSFAMSAAPVGWLACDGSAVSRTQYAGLFATVGTIYGVGNNSTTFNVPNLQGQFVRGLTTNLSTTSRDPLSATRVLGNVQQHAFQDHVHGVGQTLKNISGGSDNIAWAGGPFDIIQSTDGATTGNVTSETRPVNIALLYCIKY